MCRGAVERYLFEKLGLAGKNTVIPKPRTGQKKEITDWLEAHRAQIVSGQLVVFVDECHLLWGDLCAMFG